MIESKETNFAESISEESIKADLRYLQLLTENYPTIADASSEIINLEAILNLPKPTEHFISDPHGESDAFNHVLRNASGYIKRKVEEVFGSTISKKEKKELCTLIYYPEQKLELIKSDFANHRKKANDSMDTYYIETLHRLIKVCRIVTNKYTRSRIRKALPKEFAYIIEELLHEDDGKRDSKRFHYYNKIVESIIETQRADAFIIEICKLIQRLAIDKLHLLGDIFDRGSGAHLIMDTLCQYHHFDIVWGNHDIDWLGAAAGNRACICNVLRMSLRYGNLSTLEDGYGINLLPLAAFAMETYGNDDCKIFSVVNLQEQPIDDAKMDRLVALMHKAITIVQFKEEAKLIDLHPEFDMNDRKLLHLINKETGKIKINGKEYSLRDSNFPTIDPNNPYALSEEEELMMSKIVHSFSTSEKLKRHTNCLLSRGSMYLVTNGNLLFHAAIPLNEDGSIREVEIMGKQYKGIELMKKLGRLVKEAFSNDTTPQRRQYAIDYLWYLWCGKDSPLFNKDRMTTFERYFIDNKEVATERKGFYFEYGDNEEIMDMILDEFGVEGDSRHIINGHVPVRRVKGESPVRANGKRLVIDGGFSLAYQPKTGIAGYTLMFHSRGLELVEHQPFRSAEDAIKDCIDIKSSREIVELSEHRMYVRDTDKGKALMERVENLKKLLYAYRNGWIKEK